MSISEKKIELVQALLLLQDKATLFEIEKLISLAFKSPKNGGVAAPVESSSMTFEAWLAQLEAPELPDGEEDEYGLTATALRQHIWAAEQSKDLTLERFFEQIGQN